MADIYKSQARNLAWYDHEGEQTTNNPFKKFRRSPRRTNSVELESRLSRYSSAGAARSENGSQPKGINGGPTHSDPFPPGTGTTTESSPESLDKAKQGPLGYGDHPINTSNSTRGLFDAESEGGPRKRRIFLGVGKQSEEEDRDPKKPRDKQKFTAVGQLKATVFNSWINVFLLAAPVGIALYYVDVSPVAVFVVNFIAIIPLAAMLSFATEEIALRTGEVIGGLLNASFGYDLYLLSNNADQFRNAVELIVAIIALVADEVIIVQTSLIGSMLSNLLLVLGMCFFFGGVNRLEQHFNPVVAQTAASLLALSVGSLIIPTAFHTWSDGKSNLLGLNSTNDAGDKSKVVPLSRGTSVILLVVYGCYLFFQLKSHTDMYNAPSQKSEKIRQTVSEGDASRGIAQIGHMSAALAGSNQVPMQNPDDEPEEPQLHTYVALATLVISTVFVALCAEYMVLPQSPVLGKWLMFRSTQLTH